MEPDFLALLQAQTSLSGVPIAWGGSVQGTVYPRIVLHLVSAVPAYTLDGDPLHRSTRVQVDSFDQTFKGAREVSLAVMGAISGYFGTVDDTRFQGIFLDNEQDLSEDGADGKRVYRLSADYIVYHHPTT